MDDTVKFGEALPNWQVPREPHCDELSGQYTALMRFNADQYGADLFEANLESTDGAIWDYLPYGPFPSLSSYHRWAREMEGRDDPYFFAIKNNEIDRICGVAAYLRVKPSSGSIEVGHVNFAPALQRTRAATEAMYLMMKWVFDAGYRRYEWKCNALNIPSRRAGQRLGFSFEGVFRQSMVVKGRNRDTAWFSVIDSEWPALEAAFQAWLAPTNFDEDGRQIESLADLTSLVRSASDPLFT